MTYVDLNPVRAAMAETPEDSDHTSIQNRVKALQNKPTINLSEAIAEQYEQGFLLVKKLQLKELLAFNPNKRNLHNQLPFSLTAYIELVDWTGRIIRDDKRGHIDHAMPDILDRLDIDEKRWLTSTTQFEVLHRKRFGNRPRLLNTG